jgi:guanylate kinase
MLERFPERLIYSVSATSRTPRTGEQHGRDYFFYSREAFEEALHEKSFAEWAMVHDNYYGTPKFFLDEKMNAGQHVLLNIDVQGALQIKAAYPTAVLVFILPPSLAALEDRLRKRGMDSEEVVQTRLANARKEMEYKKKYTHLVVNDDLAIATHALESIFQKYFDSAS